LRLPARLDNGGFSAVLVDSLCEGRMRMHVPRREQNLEAWCGREGGGVSGDGVDSLM
jgi:hypothetical protein